MPTRIKEKAEKANVAGKEGNASPVGNMHSYRIYCPMDPNYNITETKQRAESLRRGTLLNGFANKRMPPR